MDGYRADPAATADAFTADGWLRTGDVGRLDAEGRLAVRGRADDAIRTGAETVWPDEVEAVLADPLRASPTWRSPGAPDAEWGAHVVAWVVPVDAARTRRRSRSSASTAATTWLGSRRRATCGSSTDAAEDRERQGPPRRSALTMVEGPSEGGVRSGLQSPGLVEGVGEP